MSCRGAARLGMEPVGATHRMALRLPMQREESRRIAKLYEFTGKVGLGSIVGRYLLRVGGRKLQVSPLRQTMKLFGFDRDDSIWVTLQLGKQSRLQARCWIGRRALRRE